MTCRAFIQLPLYVYGIDARINTQMLKNTHILLVHLEDSDNGRKRDIGTLNKDRGDIFLKYCVKRFKEKFIFYINGVLIEMVKIALKDSYLGGTTPTALKN